MTEFMYKGVCIGGPLDGQINEHDCPIYCVPLFPKRSPYEKYDPFYTPEDVSIGIYDFVVTSKTRTETFDSVKIKLTGYWKYREKE